MWHLLKRYFQPVAVILLLLSVAYAEENKDSKPGAVVDLTGNRILFVVWFLSSNLDLVFLLCLDAPPADDNFDDHISKGGIWFVKVFAPW